MNKREYIERLTRGLAGVGGAEEIIAEIEGHFADGAAKGRSEDEIAAALGGPEALAREYRNSGKFTSSDGGRQADGSGAGDKAAWRRKAVFIAAGTALAVALAVVGISVGVRQNAERQAEEDGIVSIRTPGFHLSVGNEGRVRMEAGGTTVLDVDGHRAEGLSGLEAIDGLEDADFSPGTWQGGSDLGLSGLDSLCSLDGIARMGDIYSFEPGTVVGSAGETVDLRKELPLVGIDRIYLGADAADVVVKPGQDGRARARLLGVVDQGLAKGITLDATTRGGELRFEAKVPRMHGDSAMRLVLLVELPAGCKDGISVDTAAGDVALVNLVPSKLHARSSAGDLAIQGMDFGEARLESTAGDIMVKASKGRKLELQSGAGDLLLELDGQGCSWKASSGAGDVMAPGSLGEGPSSGSTGDGSLRAELRTGAGDILIRS